MVRGIIRIQRPLAQQLRRITLSSIIVEFKEGAVFQVEFLDFPHALPLKTIRFGQVTVASQPLADQVVDIDPDRTAPHILRVGRFRESADRRHPERRPELRWIGELLHHPRRLLF